MVVASAMTEAPQQNSPNARGRLSARRIAGSCRYGRPEALRGSRSRRRPTILDNYSTLARGLRENEAGFCLVPSKTGSLAQRAAGRSVLAVHHAGKGGGQRGTSRKGNKTFSTPWTSLSRILRDVPPSEGAPFRGAVIPSRAAFGGEDAEPFEARFANGQWTTSEIVSTISTRRSRLFGLKVSLSAISRSGPASRAHPCPVA